MFSAEFSHLQNIPWYKIVFSQSTKLPSCTKIIQQKVQQMSIDMYLDKIKNIFLTLAKTDDFSQLLGRHFGCRPLDPTLDIWSNFVKKKKEKRKKAFYLLTI